ncbi:hypothetical protein, partial [Klebsiella pneumoniae]|uniref:hypothetical protein n=1 Tax=Klebsiella pneumoniae TaxID=573 RepID=UPI00249C7DF7
AWWSSAASDVYRDSNDIVSIPNWCGARIWANKVIWRNDIAILAIVVIADHFAPLTVFSFKLINI